MGFIGDWIIFSFKILLSALLGGSIGWEVPSSGKGTDIRYFVMSGTLSTMLVIAARSSVKGSQDLTLGFVIAGILVSIALISAKLIGEHEFNRGTFTGVKLLYSSSLGILIGTGNIAEAVLAALLGYVILNYLDLGSSKENEDE